MSVGNLIYHPKRILTVIEGVNVYHDSFGGNEDPYIWNEKFLHTYCHITQLKNEKGQTNFWVSGDTFPNFNHLYCDLVFVIGEKCKWKERNHITRNDDIVDNDQSFEHNYKWANEEYGHHQFKRRGRYTLKADPDKSFQPQNTEGELIDILPFLNECGIETELLRIAMNRGKGSRPFKLDNGLGDKLYEYLLKHAVLKLKGRDLQDLHPNINRKSNDVKCGATPGLSETNCGC